MVFNREVLFIHLGKTGGMSVSSYMRQTLMPPVVDVVSETAFEQIRKNKLNRIVIIGNRHANLTEAEELLKSQRLSPNDFKLIIIVVRNPIEMELSHYFHLQKEKVIRRLEKFPELDRGRLAAAALDFDEFAKTGITHFQGDLSMFFNINGRQPENLKIVKFENLATEVPGVLKPFQACTKPFPHKNKSEHKVLISNISKEALRNIRRKYAWIYDQGFYPPPA